MCFWLTAYLDFIAAAMGRSKGPDITSMPLEPKVTRGPDGKWFIKEMGFNAISNVQAMEMVERENRKLGK